MTDDRPEAGNPAQAAEPLALRLNDQLGLVAKLRDPAQAANWGVADNLMNEAADEIERLRSLLARCRPIIEADAQMMADISRHAPLDADSQAKHDATEYESEKLARELERLLGPNARLTAPDTAHRSNDE